MLLNYRISLIKFYEKLLLTVFIISNLSFSQQQTDTLQGTPQNLNEVIVKALRVKFSSPISFSNVKREQYEKRNLGQDLPILLKYLPSVVTTSDAGAGVGYTGIRVRGVSPQSTNITINGIPFNDAESMAPTGLIYLIFLHLLKVYNYREGWYINKWIRGFWC